MSDRSKVNDYSDDEDTTQTNKIFGVVSHVPNYKKQREAQWKFLVDLDEESSLSEKKSEIQLIVEKDYFLPLEVGDKISATIYGYEEDLSSNLYKIRGHPFVILNNEESGIISFIGECIRQKADKHYRELISYIIRRDSKLLSEERRIEEDKEDVERVIEFLNVLSVEYSFLKKAISFTFSERLNTLLPKILSGWYKRRIIRQLQLLGLEKKEITTINNEGEYSPLELYNECLDNPYKIASIKIKTCEKILHSQNRKPTKEMVYGGKVIRYLHQCKISKGWSFVPYYFISKEFPTFMKEIPKIADEYKIYLDYENLLSLSREGGEKLKEPRVYIQKEYDDEVFVSEYIKNLIKKNNSEGINLLNLVERSGHLSPETIEGDVKIVYTPEQLEAIKNGISSCFSIITGGAGCGKTTVIKKIVEILDYFGKRLAIASFTGKAVNRVCEVLSVRRAHTLDFLIAKKNNANTTNTPCEFDNFEYLIIDESSMTSTDLFCRMIKAYTHEFNIIMIGDKNQIPPIGNGNLFSEILKIHLHTPINVNVLSVNYRTTLKTGISQIIINSQKILESCESGDLPSLESGKEYFEFLRLSNPPDPKELITSLFEKGIKPEKFKILCPYVEPLNEINAFTQDLFHSSGECMRKYNKKWYIGDIVVMNVNDFTSGLKNGSTGKITDFTDEYLSIEFDMLDEIREFNFYFSIYEDTTRLSVDSLSLGYAMSVHKSQGSEYDIVIFYVPTREVTNSATGFFNYKLSYTAITRAKKRLFVVGDKNTYYSSLVKKPIKKYEALADRVLQNVPRVKESDSPPPFDDFFE